jgi:hypothetical protein
MNWLIYILAQTAPAAPEGWLALVLGPLGLLVASLIANYVQWQDRKKRDENMRSDLMRVTAALELNTVAMSIDKRLEKLEGRP